jgi:hypothetical protein
MSATHETRCAPDVGVDVESACNPKPKSFRQAGRNAFNVGQNDLANYNDVLSSHNHYQLFQLSVTAPDILGVGTVTRRWLTVEHSK